MAPANAVPPAARVAEGSGDGEHVWVVTERSPMHARVAAAHCMSGAAVRTRGQRKTGARARASQSLCRTRIACVCIYSVHLVGTFLRIDRQDVRGAFIDESCG